MVVLKKISIYTLLAVVVSVLFLYFGLLTNKNYGVTWDFPHHLNGGLKRLGLPPEQAGKWNLPYGPLGEAMPVLSYLFFYKELGLFAFDEAYHFPIIFFGSLGVLVCYFLAKAVFDKKAGGKIGLVACFVLALYPRWIGHSHNNMKDVFSAVGFGASVLIYLLALKAKKNKLVLYILAALIWGVSFNFKVNLFLVPLIIFFHQAFLFFRKKSEKLKYLILYGAVSVGFGFLIWSFFWEKPWEKLIYLFSYFSKANENFVVLYFGKIYEVGVNTPWHIGLGNLLVVTPALVVFLFLIGCLVICYQMLKGSANYLSLLIIWFLVVTLKYINQEVAIIDDIRQYLEVVFPLSLIAGYGGWFLLKRLVKGKLYFLMMGLFTIYGFWQVLPVSGYETSYFSEIIGGIKGAREKFDIEFWGHSMKEASKWLNENAKNGAVIYTPVAGHLTDYYRRKDILLIEAPIERGGKYWADQADYIIILNRKSFFSTYDEDIPYYFINKKVVYKVERQGVPLLWILKN